MSRNPLETNGILAVSFFQFNVGNLIDEPRIFCRYLNIAPSCRLPLKLHAETFPVGHRLIFQCIVPAIAGISRLRDNRLSIFAPEGVRVRVVFHFGNSRDCECGTGKTENCFSHN